MVVNVDPLNHRLSVGLAAFDVGLSKRSRIDAAKRWIRSGMTCAEAVA
jgi:hypothetical protein